MFYNRSENRPLICLKHGHAQHQYCHKQSHHSCFHFVVVLISGCKIRNRERLLQIYSAFVLWWCCNVKMGLITCVTESNEPFGMALEP